MRLRLLSPANQRMALTELYKLAIKGAKDPGVREAAIAIVTDCGARDDKCELQAIYDAVKKGTRYVPGMDRGVKYMTDPEAWTDDLAETIDHFTAPARLLEQCSRGICAEDCDGAGSLVLALAMALGFQGGLQIFRPSGSRYYEHVYAVVGLPKLEPKTFVGCDTTVERADIGWIPRGGEVLTAMLPEYAKGVAA